MSQTVKQIVNYLNESRGLDYTGISESMLESRIIKRFSPTDSANMEDYYNFLKSHPEELDSLVESLSIGVSWFFRDSLTFELLSKILEKEIRKKIDMGEHWIRVWSSGCSSGEEPYSVAMILNEILLKEQRELKQHIFGTDIDRSALIAAKRGSYSNDAVKNVKQGQFSAYFSAEGMQNILDSEMINKVSFSYYDLLDKKLSSPPDSVFGDFDLILCRNVLIYYEESYQKMILSKLYRSLKKGGYLVLGESEMPGREFRDLLVREYGDAKIFRKSA